MLLPVFFLSSCSETTMYVKTDPVLVFSCKAYTAINGYIIEYLLSRNENKETQIKILVPEQVKGLCFTKLQDEMLVDYNGLSIKKDTLFMPIDSFVLAVINIFEYLDKGAELKHISSENGVSTYFCSVGNFEFDVYNSSGFIREIRDLKNSLVVTMSEHSENFMEKN
ncbi:MAG: hypothetical protein RUMPE_00516 [Eubacteriales bacterium SKADARSKE-1]|nr:hypothetical protein [Eubacteriales bacterium SKADARSKE-1]